MEDGEWKSADEFFEEVLNQNAECAEAYMGKLFAKLRRNDLKGVVEYYEEKYSSADMEKLFACEADKPHIKEYEEKYEVLGYLHKDEIRRFYEYDRTYASSLSCRKKQKKEEQK